MARILLVDGSTHQTLALGSALAEAHHQVIVAGTAGEALGAALAHAPELVVLEPQVDPRPLEAGLCGELAARLPGVPLLVLTSLDDRLDPASRDRQDRDGGWLPADLYLQKPLDPALVVEQVEQLLHGGH
jgi:DNA-binding response OmpR family regulator